MSFRCLTLFGCSLVVFFSAGGCGGDDVERVAISGTVTVSGSPVAAGTLNFVPVEKGPACGCAVKDGKYEFSQERGPSPGEYKVRLTLPITKMMPNPADGEDEEKSPPPSPEQVQVTVSADENNLDLKF